MTVLTYSVAPAPSFRLVSYKLIEPHHNKNYKAYMDMSAANSIFRITIMESNVLKY